MKVLKLKMKKELSFAAFIIAATIILSSCEITRPISATSNPIGSKKGTSSTIGILIFPPMVGTGDAGVEKAAKNGNITKVSTVDWTEQWFLVFRRWSCTVTGE
jgi:hypothetical protein